MGERFAVETLDAQDRAFVESVAGIHRQLEALKLVYPGRLSGALDAMQMANATITAAAIRSPGT